MFRRPNGFLYQYVFDCFSKDWRLNSGRWKEELLDAPQPFNVEVSHVIISQEKYFDTRPDVRAEQWDKALDYLTKAVHRIETASLPFDGVLTIIHRLTYVGLVWSEEPMKPTLRVKGPLAPYLQDDWYGRPWWWDPDPV